MSVDSSLQRWGLVGNRHECVRASLLSHLQHAVDWYHCVHMELVEKAIGTHVWGFTWIHSKVRWCVCVCVPAHVREYVHVVYTCKPAIGMPKHVAPRRNPVPKGCSLPFLPSLSPSPLPPLTVPPPPALFTFPLCITQSHLYNKGSINMMGHSAPLARVWLPACLPPCYLGGIWAKVTACT